MAALAADGVRLLALDHRANGRSDGGDPARWTVPQMADDVEAVIAELGLERPVVMGHSFGSFVAQHHMAEHGSAAGYVLMGTVDSVDELAASATASRPSSRRTCSNSADVILGRRGHGEPARSRSA